jgi:hypothetical protein
MPVYFNEYSDAATVALSKKAREVLLPGFSLTHDELVELFTPPEIRRELEVARQVLKLSGARPLELAVPVKHKGVALDITVRMQPRAVGGVFPPLIPRDTLPLVGEGHPIWSKLQRFATAVGKIYYNTQVMKAVYRAVASACSKPEQLVSYLPSVARIAEHPEIFVDRSDKAMIRQLKSGKTVRDWSKLPGISPELNALCRVVDGLYTQYAMMESPAYTASTAEVTLEPGSISYGQSPENAEALSLAPEIAPKWLV